MGTSKSIAALLALCLISVAVIGQSIDHLRTFALPNENIGEGGTALIWEDEDGHEHIITIVGNGRNLARFATKNGELKAEAITPYIAPTTDGESPILMQEDTDKDMVDEYYVLYTAANIEGSTVFQFDPISLQLLDTFQLPELESQSALDYAYGDIDGDQQEEWMFIQREGLFLYSGDFAFEQNLGSPFGGQQVVFDHVLNTSEKHLVITRDQSVEIIDTSTLDLVSDLDFEMTVRSFDYEDVDGNGLTDIVVTYPRDSVVTLSANGDRLYRIRIDEPSIFGTFVNDFHSDEGLEVIIHYFDSLYCFNIADSKLLWSTGLYYVDFAFPCDFDNDNIQEMLVYGGELPLREQLFTYNAESGEQEITYDHYFVLDLECLGSYRENEDQSFLASWARTSGIVTDQLGLIRYSDLSTAEKFDYRSVLRREADFKSGHTRQQDVDVIISSIFGSTESFVFDEFLQRTPFTEPDLGSIQIVDDIDRDGLDEVISYDSDVISIHKSENDGSWTRIFQSVPFTPSAQSPDRIELLNYDDDAPLEVVLYSSSRTTIYDVETQEIAQQFEHPFSRFSQLADIDSDNKFELVQIRANGSLLYFEDDASQGIEIMDLDDVTSVQRIQLVENETQDKYLIIVSDIVQLVDLQINEVLWNSQSIFKSPFRARESLIGDFDDDQLLNILVQSESMLSEFELNFPAWTQTPIIATSTPENNSELASNGVVTICFDEILSEADVMNALSTNEPDPSLSRQSMYCYTLSPSGANWTVDILQVEVDASLKGSATSYIDGNLDGFGSGSEEDRLILNFNISIEADTAAPVIAFDRSIDPKIEGAGAAFEFFVYDTVSPAGIISEVSYMIGNQFDPTMLKPLPAQDGIYDQSTELIDFVIASDELELGFNNITLVATDDKGNTRQMPSIQIIVEDDDKSAFNRYGVNSLNTGALESDFTAPFQRVYNLGVCDFCSFQNVPLIWNDIGIASHFEQLFLFSVSTGAALLILDDIQISQPAVYNGQLYFASETAGGPVSLNSLDLTTLEFNWQVELSAEGAASIRPIVVGDYVVCRDGVLGGISGFSKYDGTHLWFEELGQGNEWIPAVLNDTIISIVEGKRFKMHPTGEFIQCVDGESGFDNYFRSHGPIVDTINELIVWYDSDLRAIDLNTLELVWQNEDYFSFSTGAVVKDDMIYVYTNMALRKFDIRTGQEIAEIEVDNNGFESPTGPPVILNDLLLLPFSSTTAVVDLVKDEQIWQFPHGGSLAIRENEVIVSNRDSVIRYRATEQCFEFVDREELLCAGDSIVINGKVYAEAGEFTDVLFAPDFGCDTLLTLSIDVNPEIELSDSLIVADNGSGTGAISVVVTGGSTPYNYTWSNGGSTSIIEGLSAGEYSVTVTDSAGCTNTFVFEVELSTSIRFPKVEKLNMYPSPATNQVTITTDQGGDLYVYDALGQVVLAQRMTSTVEVLDISALPPGMYSATVVSANFRQQGEFIKSN